MTLRGSSRLRRILHMRILIADDHEAVRKGVCAILTSRGDIEICAEAVDGQQAIEMAVKMKPDLVILDINMPVLGGFATALEIKRLLPGIPILFFTMHDGAKFVAEAKKAGVQGFVAKEKAGQVLLDAVDALRRNEQYFPA
jgi:two-component system, NarL family, response regulator DegU